MASARMGGFLELFYYGFFAVLFGPLHLLLQGFLFDQYRRLAFVIELSNSSVHGIRQGQNIAVMDWLAICIGPRGDTNVDAESEQFVDSAVVAVHPDDFRGEALIKVMFELPIGHPRQNQCYEASDDEAIGEDSAKVDFPPCFDAGLRGGCGLLHFGAAVLKIAEGQFHRLQRSLFQGIGKPRGDFFHVDTEDSRVKLPFEVRADLADVRGSMPNLVVGKADGAGCLALSFRLRLELRPKTDEKIAERLEQLAVVTLRDG